MSWQKLKKTVLVSAIILGVSFNSIAVAVAVDTIKASSDVETIEIKNIVYAGEDNFNFEGVLDYRNWDMPDFKDAKIQSKLGAGYYRGVKHVPRDYAKALVWYKKAANQGLSEAQYKLGEMYHKGIDVSKDYKKRQSQLIVGF